MSYQVLARKWRPRSFGEVVGQEHILRALINALDHNRLHHAYLFSGTRGVGKTTLARILAKSFNCESGVSASPCGECTACREIDEGRFVDLIEVDAASRTKVEDTRELLENVQYAPSRGRYKVYLVDEVHMLSTHSFNALLKTLEEPPPHVKFLLATTEPQKLPVTILSRCLQFNLKRLPLELIGEYLAHIVKQEGVEADTAALTAIARAADGSMRDALSLLDQAIAHGGGALQEQEVCAMLGVIDQNHVTALVEALAAGDGTAMLERVQRLAEGAPDYDGVLGELTALLQRIALAQVVPEVVDDTRGDRELVMGLAGWLSPEDVQLFYQIGLIGRRDLGLAPDPQSGFEMVLLRMLAFRPARAATASTPGGRRAAESVAPAAASAADAPPSRGATPEKEGVTAWTELVPLLDLNGLARELAVNCVLTRREGDAFELLLDDAHAQLHSTKLEERIRRALGKHFGGPIRLRIAVGTPPEETPAKTDARRTDERQRKAEEAIRADEVVKAIEETFDADVRAESIRPID